MQAPIPIPNTTIVKTQDAEMPNMASAAKETSARIMADKARKTQAVRQEAFPFHGKRASKAGNSTMHAATASSTITLPRIEKATGLSDMVDR